MKIRKLHLVFAALLLQMGFLSAQAQKLDLDKFENMDVRSIGPAGMSGRVTAIDVVADNPQIMYIGSASGGVWKSESGGVDWEPIFDDQQILSIGAVAIQQSNPDVIWVGTGEGNPRNSSNGGYGLYKSIDGGKSWKLMGLEKTRNIHRVRIDPTNPDVVYVGAIGSPWGEHPERGVYKTTDGGKSWEKVLYVNEKTGTAELIMDPNNPNKLFAAMWEHRRKPYTFNSGGPGSGLYMTVDGGENWKELTSDDGLPKGDLGRIGLAIPKANSKKVYALVESKDNALYRSDDGGYNWKKINDDMSEIGNRPFYYSEIYADPINENKIYTIFTYVNVSIDGGKSFEELMPAYGTSVGVHPDHHAWYIHPENPDLMLDGNDGGLNITHDGGESWRFVQNLPVGQFYHINVDMDYPYNVYGGMQDNGSWSGPAYVWKSQGIRNSYWQELAFGDGFDVVPDLDNSRYGFAQSQQGFVVRYDQQTGKQQIVRPTHPDKDVILRFNWNAAIARNPHAENSVYFGSQFVHKTTDNGQTWEIISPDLTTDNPEKQKQFESGGLTFDATGAENNTTITAIAPSALNEDIVWAGTDDGNIQITTNGGESWTEVGENSKDMPDESWVAQIQASAYNEGEAFVVVNNYRNFDFKPYVLHTTNYGKSWENLTSSDEVWTYALSIVQDPIEPNLLFLGTDGGLYFSINKGNSWQKWTKNYPNTPTRDLVIHPREHDLVIGTFGRAIWIMDDIRPLRKIAAEGKDVLNKELILFDPPTAYNAEYQQPPGSRFGANALFNGENRPGGAMLSFWYNLSKEDKEEEQEEDEKKEEEEADKSEKKKDKLYFTFYNQSGEQIREIEVNKPKEKGLHRFYWYMREAGSYSPSRRITSDDAREPRGNEVLPGTYKVVLSYADLKDSVQLDVKYDPRLQHDEDALRERFNFLEKVEAMEHTAYTATQQLAEAKKAAETYMRLMKEEDKDKYEALIKQSKEMVKAIDSLFIPFVGEDFSDKQGIIRTPIPSISDRIGTASYYTAASNEAPGETQEQLFEQAKAALKEGLDQVNNFFESKFSDYEQEVKSIELSLFKEREQIQIED